MSRWRVSGSFFHCLLILGLASSYVLARTLVFVSDFVDQSVKAANDVLGGSGRRGMNVSMLRGARGRGIFGPTDVPVESKWFFFSLSSDSRPRMR
jgi:hypothetical protein